mgnify:CR=1 FL=1|jgi:hypothetical protein
MNEILGLDHICATSKNIRSFSKNSKLFNYDVYFIEKNFLVDDKKNDILFGKNISHDALFLKNLKNTSIELIEHHQENDENTGPYNVIYESPSLDNIGSNVLNDNETTKYLSKIFNSNIHNFFDKQTNLSFFWKNSHMDLGLTTIILETKNLENSINFWTKNFNFKILDSLKISSCKLLQLNSPVKSWNTTLLLIENLDKKIETLFLNSKGWTCLSFIVKNIDSFLSEINNSDFSFIGNPYEIKIGGKNLKLVFLRGPEQQLLELVEIKQNHD